MNISFLETQRPGLTVSRFMEGGEQGIDVKVADLATVAEPVHLKLERPFEMRLRVTAGRSTRLQLILDERSGLQDSAGSSLKAEFTLASGACVKFLHVRRGGVKARQASKSVYHLGAHADLEVFSFVSDGAETSSDHAVVFEAEHGFASFKGLSILKGSSSVQDRIIADHASANCTSRQFYKNVLAGSARSEFHSLVAVKPGAVKSDSRQLNKNLLLSDTARAEARPELRIDADDVACQHGATVGRIDKDELFYLRSRGLSEARARYVMTLGFAQELIDDIEPAALREEVRARAKAEIKEALGFAEGE